MCVAGNNVALGEYCLSSLRKLFFFRLVFPSKNSGWVIKLLPTICFMAAGPCSDFHRQVSLTMEDVIIHAGIHRRSKKWRISIVFSARALLCSGGRH